MELGKEIWIFLSHSNEDYDKVRKVRNMLEEQNLRPIMFFLKCLSDDDEIDSLIKREIDCRTRFILCDSENSRKSKWVQKEVEYIKEKQKQYEIIDLNLPDDEILKQLKEVKRKCNIFLSCSLQDYMLVEHVLHRLRKYDFNIFFDEEIFGGSIMCQMSSAISHAVDEGYVITLLTNTAIKSKYVMYELQYAIDNAKEDRIIVVNLTDNHKSFADLQKIKLIDYSNFQNIDYDEICDAILGKLLGIGEIFTYYNNFKNGKNCNRDLIEAERLGKLCFRRADELDSENFVPGTMILGRCYEYGIGTDVDLMKAYRIYSDPIATDGLARKDAQRLYNILFRKESENEK